MPPSDDFPTDRPAVPPPGTASVFPLAPLHCAGGPAELHGLLVHGDGRLTIANHGAGLAVRLQPDTARSVALLLWCLAGELEAQHEKAAAALDAALARRGGADA